MSKIKPETIEEIKHLESRGLSDAEISEKIGCCRSTVNLYKNGRTWKDKREGQTREFRFKKKFLPDDVDFSELPDDVLFSPKLFPVF